MSLTLPPAARAPPCASPRRTWFATSVGCLVSSRKSIVAYVDDGSVNVRRSAVRAPSGSPAGSGSPRRRARSVSASGAVGSLYRSTFHSRAAGRASRRRYLRREGA